jgi:hypothetical protein
VFVKPAEVQNEIDTTNLSATISYVEKCLLCPGVLKCCGDEERRSTLFSEATGVLSRYTAAWCCPKGHWESLKNFIHESGWLAKPDRMNYSHHLCSSNLPQLECLRGMRDRGGDEVVVRRLPSSQPSKRLFNGAVPVFK